jgi:hypothetical protein
MSLRARCLFFHTHVLALPVSHPTCHVFASLTFAHGMAIESLVGCSSLSHRYRHWSTKAKTKVSFMYIIQRCPCPTEHSGQEQMRRIQEFETIPSLLSEVLVANSLPSSSVGRWHPIASPIVLFRSGIAEPTTAKISALCLSGLFLILLLCYLLEATRVPLLLVCCPARHALQQRVV